MRRSTDLNSTPEMMAVACGVHHTQGAGTPISGALLLSGGTSQAPALVDLWLEGFLCDINIVVDGHLYRAHRVVLASGSAYFKAFFASGMLDSAGDIFLQDICCEAFASVLEFLYRGRCTLESEDAIVGTLQAAAMLQVLPLAQAAAEAIIERLSPVSCVGAWQLGSRLMLPRLEAAAREEALRGFEHLVREAGGATLSALEFGWLKSLIADDALCVDSEESVFEALRVWIAGQSVAPLSDDVAVLLKLVRWPLLSASFVKEHALATPFFCDPRLRLIAARHSTECQSCSESSRLIRRGSIPLRRVDELDADTPLPPEVDFAVMREDAVGLSHESPMRSGGDFMLHCWVLEASSWTAAPWSRVCGACGRVVSTAAQACECSPEARHHCLKWNIDVLCHDESGSKWIRALDEGATHILGKRPQDIQSLAAPTPDTLLTLVRDRYPRRFLMRCRLVESVWRFDGQHFRRYRTACVSAAPSDFVREGQLMLGEIRQLQREQSFT